MIKHTDVSVSVYMHIVMFGFCNNGIYRQASNIKHNLVANKIVDHSDVPTY